MKPVLAALVLASLLLAGCTSSVDRPPMSARPETRSVPASPDYPGLVVEGTLRADAAGLVIDAVARNDGNRTYQVETGCTTPWTVHLFRGNQSVHLAEPTAHCLAFALQDLPPGTNLTFSTSWDGIVWSEESHRRVTAPAGDYVWSVRFAAYREDQGVKRFDLDFPVTIGAL